MCRDLNFYALEKFSGFIKGTPYPLFSVGPVYETEPSGMVQCGKNAYFIDWIYTEVSTFPYGPIKVTCMVCLNAFGPIEMFFGTWMSLGVQFRHVF